MTHAYRGRFAPTPSGPLHRGSLVAAIASFLDARAAGGDWLVRIDDLDGPRVAPGAEAAILAELTRLGLHPDQPVSHQADRGAAYAKALAELAAVRRLQNAAASAEKKCVCSGRRPEGKTRKTTFRLYEIPGEYCTPKLKKRASTVRKERQLYLLLLRTSPDMTMPCAACPR